ncbi:ABC transporter substrate-binding protein [Novosphingobium sp.]|uniref:ABC transporter substrate-binding protein n=1 Tax=Novosphingobium sp. TaxID=1874826 RepID=UPI00262856C1|nr:ABC transporter substrate-binding protein [Novosphingobium sp.]
MAIVRVAERRAGGDRRGIGARVSLLLAATGALGLAGCAAAPGSTPAPVRSGIVSLNPCTDAVLAEVADPGQIRALSAYSSDPGSSSMDVAVARRFPAVSGTVEEIAALRPALVIGGTFTPPATRAALARLGIALVELPIARDVPESLAQVRRIAALAGQPARGEALVGRIEGALAAARPAHSRAVSALVWQSGGIVPGEASLIADLLRRTGFSNAAAARGLGQADYLPLERVLIDPPEVILAAGGRDGADRLLNHPVLTGLTATRRVPFDSALLWCGGPTIIRAAARLAQVRRMAEGAGSASPRPDTP